MAGRTKPWSTERERLGPLYTVLSNMGSTWVSDRLGVPTERIWRWWNDRTRRPPRWVRERLEAEAQHIRRLRAQLKAHGERYPLDAWSEAHDIMDHLEFDAMKGGELADEESARTEH